MTEAAGRRIAGYSKGMRQRIKLAQAIAHEPRVLILDEPLNGLDPLARAEVDRALPRASPARAGRWSISSHILHEVDELADRVVLIHGGYIVAEGAIDGVRDEMSEERPLQVLVRCDRPSAARRARLRRGPRGRGAHRRRRPRPAGAHAQRRPLLRLLGRLAAAGEIEIEAVMPADDDVQAVYQYLIGGHGQGSS